MSFAIPKSLKLLSGTGIRRSQEFRTPGYFAPPYATFLFHSAAQAVSEIEALATSTDLSVRQIQSKIAGRASRSIVGEITKRARAPSSPVT